jgi:hypothetical protein
VNVRGCTAPLEGRAVLCLLNCGLCLRVPGRQAAGKRCAPGLLRCPRHGSRCAIQSTWRSPISSLPGATCEDRETVRATLAPRERADSPSGGRRDGHLDSATFRRAPSHSPDPFPEACLPGEGGLCEGNDLLRICSDGDHRLLRHPYRLGCFEQRQYVDVTRLPLHQWQPAIHLWAGMIGFSHDRGVQRH